MQKLAVVFLILFLIGCSDPKPKTYAGFYDAFREANGPNFQYVMAGPDVRWFSEKSEKMLSGIKIFERMALPGMAT